MSGGGQGPVAILVVAGGDDPRRFRWLEACLDAIARHTDYPDHRVYLWNNDTGHPEVDRIVAGRDRCTRFDADPVRVLGNPHAEGLQHLFEAARSEGARYVVTLDTDAQPVRDDWLSELIGALDAGAAVAGIWYQERPEFIDPYVHPSCLATTVDFVAARGLRFDDIKSSGPARAYDTASHFTEAAQQEGLAVHALPRTNRNELDPVLAGIYGDIVYHHGGGSRRFAPVDSVDGGEAIRYREIRDLGAEMMLDHRGDLLAWLRGAGLERRVFLVLGMHRSGTSCLTGCLEQCGVHLGGVERHSINQPLGNLEQRRVMELNDALLAAAGGGWREPPPGPVPPDAGVHAEIAAVVADLETAAPSALKDPRALLTLDAWLAAAADPAPIGTFRHPDAVARSLYERQRIPAAEAHELWRRYNEQLVALHRKRPFPLVEFDLSDRESYCRTVAALAAELGLQPRLKSLLDFVQSGYGSTTVEAGAPVPPSCAELYAYLREHRYEGRLEPDSFPARLAAWGELVEVPMKLRPWRDLELWAWNVARRLPRPLRAATMPIRRAVRRLRVRRESGGGGRRRPPRR